MKRAMAPVEVEVVEHDGYLYSTLDFAPLSRAPLQTHSAYLPLRAGWELVPHSDSIVESVVKKCCWGQEALIFACGTAYLQLTGAVAPPPGGSTWLAKKSIPRFGEATVGVKPVSDRARILIRTPVPNTDVALNIGARLWKKRRFTDYVLACGDEEICCHRAVLADASLVFASAFDSGMQEAAQGRYELQDTRPRAVQLLVEFCYTGHLAVPSADDLTELVKLGDRFQIEALVQACLEPLLEALDKGIVASVAKALRGMKEQPGVKPHWEKLIRKVRARADLVEAVLDSA